MPDWADLFDADTPIQPPLTDEALAGIPARRGVFLVEGPDHAPVLLAAGADIRARLRFRLSDADAPTRRADLRQVARRLRWKLTDSRFETDWQYLELARAVFPQRYRRLLSFPPAWFVHVDPADEAPALRRTRDVLDRPGRHYGPFPDGRSAQRFTEILGDVFDLCRREQVLRQAPNARPCMYAQMGRCRAYCDGSASMDDYRGLIERACRAIEGDRRALRQSLTEQMRRLAEQRRYEAAGACKARLERLAELDAPAYQHVAAIERFRFLLVQRGPRSGQAKSFLAAGGAIRPGPVLTVPLQTDALDALLSQMAGLKPVAERMEPPGAERIALVAHYLFSRGAHRGLIVRYGEDLTPERLAEQIDSAAEPLRLRRKARVKASAPGRPRPDRPGGRRPGGPKTGR